MAVTECCRSRNLLDFRGLSHPARSAKASCHTHASAIYTAADIGIFSVKTSHKGIKTRTAAQRPATMSSEPYPEYERAN